MKKYLLLCSALVVASSAYALDCATPPTCEDLGFTMSADECAGKFTLKCPFDNTNVFCGMNINDGTACQSKIGDMTVITSSSTLLGSGTDYLYPENCMSCGTNGITLGANSTLNSYCAFSECYCTDKPGYCQATITLADGSAVKGIELQSVLTLNINGATTLYNTDFDVELAVLNTGASGKNIAIQSKSTGTISTLRAAYSGSPTYNIVLSSGSYLTITNLGVHPSFNPLTTTGVATVNVIMNSNTKFTYKGTTYTKGLSVGNTALTCTIIASVNGLQLGVCK
ncbi:MAG: hypothetical protein E7020_02410 [Alphaproteobacteria bacterium]|nr:hypothetical protein [Alphaproteobacteria bacterium]